MLYSFENLLDNFWVSLWQDCFVTCLFVCLFIYVCLFICVGIHVYGFGCECVYMCVHHVCACICVCVYAYKGQKRAMDFLETTLQMVARLGAGNLTQVLLKKISKHS